jgi:hypothetical protein
MSTVSEAFRLEFSVQEFPTVRFELLVQVSKHRRMYSEDHEQGYTKAPVLYRGHHKIFKFVYISRLDSYKGPCEDFSNLHNLPADLCVCNEAYVQLT